MKKTVALCVLLCCCLTNMQVRGNLAREKDSSPAGSQVRGAEDPETTLASNQQVCEPDIHTVLREMSVLIAEQRVALTSLESRLIASENKAEATEVRLRDSEKMVAEQRVELRYTQGEVETMEARLRTSEKTVEEQRAIIKELKETQEKQAAALGALGEGQNLTGSQVEELRWEREESKVSFSTSITSSGDITIGPFGDSHPVLVYKHVFSNIGNTYNPHTGIFTAPVRGMYHFVFFVFGDGHASTCTGISLYKNGEHIALAHAQQSNYNMTPSNGVSLVLELGDVVYLKLFGNCWVRDTSNHHSTFSGHLLFLL